MSTESKHSPAARKPLFTPARLLVGILSILVIAALVLGWIMWRSHDKFWTTVETGLYTVQIPDGWTVTHFTESDTIRDGDCASCMRYKAGSRATILPNSYAFNKEDERSAFLLRPRASGQKDEAALFAGYEKLGRISAKNVSGNTYRLTTIPQESRGAPQTTYGYAFTKGSTTIFITHTFGAGGTDSHKIVERLIATLELK